MENMTGKTIFGSAALCVQNINAVYPGGWNLDRYVSKFTQIYFEMYINTLQRNPLHFDVI